MSGSTFLSIGLYLVPFSFSTHSSNISPQASSVQCHAGFKTSATYGIMRDDSKIKPSFRPTGLSFFDSTSSFCSDSNLSARKGLPDSQASRCIIADIVDIGNCLMCHSMTEEFQTPVTK